MSSRIRLHPLVLAALFWPIAFASAEAQQQGTVTGRVTDAGSGQPIVAAQVAVVGTNLGSQTNSDGQYTIRGAPVGAVGDLRRLIRQHGRAAESVFPTGAWHKGGSYGTNVNLPIPQAEENNPNVPAGKTCIDRNA